MRTYRRNHVKITIVTTVTVDGTTVNTERFAIRSGFDDQDPATEHLAWTVLGGDRAGTSRAKTSEVDDWDDLYEPEETES